MPIKPSKLVKQIFDQNAEMRATVEAQSIVDSDRGYYEPVLLGMRAIKSYNEFEGPKVEKWLRSRIMDASKGPVIYFRFGREFSPVLYVTIATAIPDANGNDYRKLTGKERREIAQSLVNEGKSLLAADSARIISPGVVRLWWD